MLKRIFQAVAIMVLVSVTTLPTSAVTDKEMEEARAITAKAYLRYANDGSGYLDDVTAKSMSELNSKLKAKEKENIKAFNSVKVPTDYASWDKEKLVEFWAVTFFTSPSLDAKGKLAKTRVRRQISAMNISAPAKKDEAKPEEPKPLAATPAPTVEGETTGAATQPGAAPMAGEAAQSQEEILSDQNAIEKDAADAVPPTPEEQSHTWVYVLVLAILVGVVIWLVVYAANLMKRQPGADSDTPGGADTEELREQARKAIAKKNEEIEELRKRLQAEEGKSANLGMELERIKLDRNRQDDKIAQLRDEINSLNRQLAASGNVHAETRREPERESAREAVRRETERPVRREPEPEQRPILKVIYLGRANARGIFVRADRRINAGNTIFRLDTNDGLVGTFHVVDEPEVVDVALSNPMEYLGNGCTGENLTDTAGVTRIVTESAGTAIFENGYWKILRKTKIRYE